MAQHLYLLPEDRIPARWYNLAADLPSMPPPPLNPGTGQPLGPDRLDARTLLSQMLRRASLVLDLHLGVRPAPYDAPAMLAAVVPTLSDDRRGLRWRDWSRYSGRQKQEMNLGGVTGAWTLRADPAALAPFLPWLRLGQWLHLGKNTTMGLGGYRLQGYRVGQTNTGPAERGPSP